MRAPATLGALVAAAVFAGGAGLVTPPLATRQLPPEPTHPVLYVALGDSTVHGVGASHPASNYVSRLFERLRSVYPHARLANLGVSGATAADVLKGQLQRAVALRPHLVTLSIGPNDITRGRQAGHYERDVEVILRTLTGRTAAVVVVNLIPDLTVTPRFRGTEKAAAVGRKVVLWNRVLERQARAYGAEVVDLYGPSREEVPRHPELIGADGYHPSDAGYARWAELMWRGIEARIGR
jgi:lysophospholipase L1-like esterase